MTRRFMFHCVRYPELKRALGHALGSGELIGAR